MEGSSVFDEKEYKVLSYILLNVEKPGVFNGSFEEISSATGIPVNEVKYIVTKKLREKGVIKLFAEPSIDDVLSRVEEYIAKIDKRDVNDKDIHRLIQIKDDYSNFDKLLRKLLRVIRTWGDDQLRLGSEDLVRLFALNQRLDGFRNLLNASVLKAKRELEEGNNYNSLIEYVKASLLLYLMIPVFKRSNISLNNGLSIEILEPNIHLVNKRIELLEEIAANIANLLERSFNLDKGRLSIGVVKLFLSLKKEISILKNVAWIVSRIESI